MSKGHVFAIIVAGAMAASLSTAASAQAVTRGGSCPPGHSGYVVWNVDTEPYRADNRVDEAGNQNGIVCAKPMKVVVDDDGQPFQIYNFIDDVVATH